MSENEEYHPWYLNNTNYNNTITKKETNLDKKKPKSTNSDSKTNNSDNNKKNDLHIQSK